MFLHAFAYSEDDVTESMYETHQFATQQRAPRCDFIFQILSTIRAAKREKSEKFIDQIPGSISFVGRHENRMIIVRKGM